MHSAEVLSSSFPCIHNSFHTCSGAGSTHSPMSKTQRSDPGDACAGARSLTCRTRTRQPDFMRVPSGRPPQAHRAPPDDCSWLMDMGSLVHPPTLQKWGRTLMMLLHPAQHGDNRSAPCSRMSNQSTPTRGLSPLGTGPAVLDLQDKSRPQLASRTGGLLHCPEPGTRYNQGRECSSLIPLIETSPSFPGPA